MWPRTRHSPAIRHEIGHHQRMAGPQLRSPLFALGRRGLATGLAVVVLNGIVMGGR